MIKKLSDKDKKDWQEFLSSKEKIPDKEFQKNKKFQNRLIKRIDLHGFSLKDANNKIANFIVQCFEKKVGKIIVITGKGHRSNNISNPYISKDLSILKYSVPEFIESNKDLMKIIYEIKGAEIKDGGSGAFYIFLKKIKE